MNRSLQNRIDRLSKTNPQRAYVFWVPPGRSDETNIKEANLWLEGMGLPPKKQPMIFEIEKQTEMCVETIDDLGALLAGIMEKNTSRARRH